MARTARMVPRKTTGFALTWPLVCMRQQCSRSTKTSNNSVQQNWNPNKNKWNVAQRKPTGDKNGNNSVNQQRYNNSNQPRYNYRQRNSCFRCGNVGHWKNECTVRTRTGQGTTSGQGTTGKLPSKIRTKTTKPMGGLANYINYKQKVNKYKNIYSINNTERNRNQLSHL